MSERGDDDFRPRPSPPRGHARQLGFVAKVLKQVGQRGGPAAARRLGARQGGPRRGGRPGSGLGRGHTAAQFAGDRLAPDSRRALVKALLVRHRQPQAPSLAKHLSYIERDGVGRDGAQVRAFGAVSDEADLEAFRAECEDDRHHFRFVISPEDAAELKDLRTYTRHLMARMEADLGTRLTWVAVDHWNTDNPHIHVVVRGRDDGGNDLIIAGDYIAKGLRHRAAELATQWLGPRSELEIEQSLRREVSQDRWTSLDRRLEQEQHNGTISLERLGQRQDALGVTVLVGRLQHLEKLGLARPIDAGTWVLDGQFAPKLRALGERGDVIRTLQRAMGDTPRELSIFASNAGFSIAGRVVAKGLADELQDRGYLVIDGIDGKAHYVTVNAREDMAQYRLGGMVEVEGVVLPRESDKAIAEFAREGRYVVESHLAALREGRRGGQDPSTRIKGYVRRLEALRREGIVHRISEGIWSVPADLPEHGRLYDEQRQGGANMRLRCHLPLHQQIVATGATWLDHQLIWRRHGVSQSGFGSEVHEALHARADHLVELGLAHRRGNRLVLARNLLATLRGRELDAAGQQLAAELGTPYRPAVAGASVRGIYWQDLQLSSGRFAVLANEQGFHLVPWRPVIDARMGQLLEARLGAGGVSWEIGRQRGPMIG